MKKIHALVMLATFVFTVSGCGKAVAATGAPYKKSPMDAATGRKLTGYECARMERLVAPTAEIMGMKRPDRYDVLLREERESDLPEAFNALIRFLDMYRDETLIRNQYELKLEFAKACKAGKLHVLMPTDPKTWTGHDSRTHK